MSSTRRHWLLHRVLPVGAVMAAGIPSAGAAAAAATGPAPHVDRRTKQVISLDRKLRVHPLLQYGAQVEPDKLVRVIVQKKSGGHPSRDIAARVSRHVIAEYPMIGAFLVEIPQKLAQKLAAHPHVRYVSLDADVKHQSIDVSSIKTAYTHTLNLAQIWNGSAPATGNGVTVAVLDSGINFKHPAFDSRVISLTTNGDNLDALDPNGHGTHVAGIIKGRDPQGRYIGVAPDARVISIKIGNRFGACRESDLLNGLQWVKDNRAAYNIRVVNLSVSGAKPISYLTSPLAGAVEQLWNLGVVVVVAAGNRGTQASQQTWYAPGNDPFVITVGALDDNQTASGADDSLAPYSSRGLTQDNFYKPDIVAPGRKIAAPLAGSKVVLARQHPTQIVDGQYIRLSGTSMATPVVSGVVALLLERYPGLTPNQVKWLLLQTMKPYPAQADSAGMVDPVAAFQRAAQGSIGQANQGLLPSAAIDPVTGGVLGASTYWEATYWEATYWEAATWEADPDDPNAVPYDPAADPNFLAELGQP